MAEYDYLRIIGSDVKEKLAQADMVVIPFGSIEYHGPHAPLGTDSLIAQEVAKRVSEELNAILCPLIAYTNCPILTRNNPGTLSIDLDVMSAYVENIFRGLFRNGTKCIFTLNAHDGNIDTIKKASDRLYFEFPDRVILSINWWESLPTSLIDSLDLFTRGGGHGHGGPLETSAAWAVATEAVDLSRAADIEPMEDDGSILWIYNDGGHLPAWPGYGGLISESSIEKGEILLRLSTTRIVEDVRKWLQRIEK